MDKNQQLNQIRSRKLGLLILDARIAARRTPQDCAQAMAIPLELFLEYEKGTQSPSLPEIENLAFYLNTPLEHFWGKESLSARQKPENIDQKEQLRKIRNRLIGLGIRMERERVRRSLSDLAQITSIPEEIIQQFESGELPVPVPQLEAITHALDMNLEKFFDQKGPVGKWRFELAESDLFFKLSAEQRAFLTAPVNLPYLTLAIRLSNLSAEKLRQIAEAILEITF